jgi:hypothetical protein
MPDQLQELAPGPRVLVEHAVHGARRRDRVLLLDAAHGHAEMRGFHDDGHAQRRENRAERLGHL